MTTIAYDHKNNQVAVDSRATAGTKIISDKAHKYIEKDGAMWFFTGAIADFDQLIALNHNDKPDIIPDCAAIKVCDDGVYLVTFNGDYCSVCPLRYSYSIGSGENYATSSMDFGSSAKDAVKYASTRDCHTGGKVHVFDTKKMKFVK